MDEQLYSFNSVEVIPDLKASAAFTVNSSEVFKEQEDTLPVTIDKDMQYMPWGAANDMPYKILDLIESDETLSTCQIFKAASRREQNQACLDSAEREQARPKVNAEVCYGSGLVYDSTEAKALVFGVLYPG